MLVHAHHRCPSPQRQPGWVKSHTQQFMEWAHALHEGVWAQGRLPAMQQHASSLCISCSVQHHLQADLYEMAME